MNLRRVEPFPRPRRYDPGVSDARDFARIVAHEGDRVELAFDLDEGRWPWLILPPVHPVVVGKYQYYGGLAAFWALTGTDPSVMTALTQIRWSVHDLDAGAHGRRGTCERRLAEGRDNLDLVVLDPGGDPMWSADFHGVAFPNRNFEQWRAHTKAKARQAAEGLPSPERVPAAALGLGAQGKSLVSALRSDGEHRVCHGLVGEDDFFPAHPYHTGAGDHVNAMQLFEAAYQAAHLATDSPSLRRCVGGSARFSRFVEVGVPFDVRVVGVEGSRVKTRIVQLGEPCCSVHLTLE